MTDPKTHDNSTNAERIEHLSNDIVEEGERLGIEEPVPPTLKHGEEAKDPSYGSEVLKSPVDEYLLMDLELKKLQFNGQGNTPEARMVDDAMRELYDKMSREDQHEAERRKQHYELCEACKLDDWTDCETPDECHAALIYQTRETTIREERDRAGRAVLALEWPASRSDVFKAINDNIKPTTLSSEQLAIQAYYAYGAVTDFKNFQGNPMPEWEDLTDAIRAAWKHAASWVHRILRAEEAVQRLSSHSR